MLQHSPMRREAQHSANKHTSFQRRSFTKMTKIKACLGKHMLLDYNQLTSVWGK